MAHRPIVTRRPRSYMRQSIGEKERCLALHETRERYTVAAFALTGSPKRLRRPSRRGPRGPPPPALSLTLGKPKTVTSDVANSPTTRATNDLSGVVLAVGQT